MRNINLIDGKELGHQPIELETGCQAACRLCDGEQTRCRVGLDFVMLGKPGIEMCSN